MFGWMNMCLIPRFACTLVILPVQGSVLRGAVRVFPHPAGLARRCRHAAVLSSVHRLFRCASRVVRIAILKRSICCVIHDVCIVGRQECQLTSLS